MVVEDRWLDDFKRILRQFCIFSKKKQVRNEVGTPQVFFFFGGGRFLKLNNIMKPNKNMLFLEGDHVEEWLGHCCLDVWSAWWSRC